MSRLEELLQDPAASAVYRHLARLGPTQAQSPWEIAYETQLPRGDVEQALAALRRAGVVRALDLTHPEGGAVEGFMLDSAEAAAAQAPEHPRAKPEPRVRPSGLAEREL